MKACMKNHSRSCLMYIILCTFRGFEDDCDDTVSESEGSYDTSIDNSLHSYPRGHDKERLQVSMINISLTV